MLQGASVRKHRQQQHLLRHSCLTGGHWTQPPAPHHHLSPMLDEGSSLGAGSSGGGEPKKIKHLPSKDDSADARKQFNEWASKTLLRPVTKKVLKRHFNKTVKKPVPKRLLKMQALHQDPDTYEAIMEQFTEVKEANEDPQGRIQPATMLLS